jgi:hypothetical protein
VELSSIVTRNHRSPISTGAPKTRRGGVWANTTIKGYNKSVSRCCHKLGETIYKLLLNTTRYFTQLNNIAIKIIYCFIYS